MIGEVGWVTEPRQLGSVGIRFPALPFSELRFRHPPYPPSLQLMETMGPTSLCPVIAQVEIGADENVRILLCQQASCFWSDDASCLPIHHRVF